MPGWILLVALLLIVILLVLFWWNLGWFERHPWPGSTRREIEEQIKRSNREIGRDRNKQHPQE